MANGGGRGDGDEGKTDVGGPILVATVGESAKVWTGVERVVHK